MQKRRSDSKPQLTRISSTTFFYSAPSPPSKHPPPPSSGLTPQNPIRELVLLGRDRLGEEVGVVYCARGIDVKEIIDLPQAVKLPSGYPEQKARPGNLSREAMLMVPMKTIFSSGRPLLLNICGRRAPVREVKKGRRKFLAELRDENPPRMCITTMKHALKEPNVKK